jgi:hypothetical protein
LLPLEPLGLLGLFGVVLELPLLLLPLMPPLGLLGEELPPEADDGLLDALEPPAALWSRWHPARARARDAATIIRTFIDPPFEKGNRHSAIIGPG